MANKAKTKDQETIHKKSLVLARGSKKGVIPYMHEEVANFEEEVARFRAGDVDEKTFMPFRLRQGVYGQRQPNTQMMRVKIPGGILTPEALEALGTIAREFASLKKGHLTTRENMQFHHVRLEDAAGAMKILGDAGLSTREACGNTVRNVVGSPTAGVCPDELFDPTPYMTAYVRFAVRHPLTQNFPRKFKTSFTGCASHDTVASLIHDLSFVAQIKKEKGAVKRGFKVFVGGATSIMPRLAKPLYDFVSVDDSLRVSLGVWTVFNKADILRKNRMMARIKVLIEKIGIDAFREQVDEELKHIGPIDPGPLMDAEKLYRETPPPLPRTSSNSARLPEQFLRWRGDSVAKQKQPGYLAVYVNIPAGDIHAHQFGVLADVVRRHSGGRARVTQEQDLLLRWVPEQHLYDVWTALSDVALAEPGANTVADIVTCPGTDSCKMGITSTMGLGRALRESMATWDGLLDDPLIKKLRIKASGCPNGCAQHHVANIGFQGAAIKGPTGAQVPAYEILLGGSYGGSIEGTRFGQRLAGMKVPAREAPQFLRDALIFYRENRREGEEFNQFVDRLGVKAFEPLAAKYHEVPALGPKTINLYFDWDKTVLFKVERGEGECSV